MEFEDNLECLEAEMGLEAGLSEFAFEMEMEEDEESPVSSSRASSVDAHDCANLQSVHPSSFFHPLAGQGSANNSPTCVAQEMTNHSSWECAFADAFKGLEPALHESKPLHSAQPSPFKAVAVCMAG